MYFRMINLRTRNPNYDSTWQVGNYLLFDNDQVRLDYYEKAWGGTVLADVTPWGATTYSHTICGWTKDPTVNGGTSGKDFNGDWRSNFPYWFIPSDDKLYSVKYFGFYTGDDRPNRDPVQFELQAAKGDFASKVNIYFFDNATKTAMENADWKTVLFVDSGYPDVRRSLQKWELQMDLKRIDLETLALVSDKDNLKYNGGGGLGSVCNRLIKVLICILYIQIFVFTICFMEGRFE